MVAARISVIFVVSPVYGPFSSSILVAITTSAISVPITVAVAVTIPILFIGTVVRAEATGWRAVVVAHVRAARP
jgi:hypothetical protein